MEKTKDEILNEFIDAISKHEEKKIDIMVIEEPTPERHNIGANDAIEFAEWMEIHTKKIHKNQYKCWIWKTPESCGITQGGLFSIKQLYALFIEHKATIK